VTKLVKISGDEAIKALQILGFVVVRQKGSHIVMKKESATKSTGCVVPLHKELAVGTLRSIIRQADLTIEEFVNALK